VMSGPTVEWLVQEISDLLDAGSVGLNEFVDELNDPAHPMPLDRRKAIARQALDDFISRGDIEIKWQRWADGDSSSSVRPDDLPADPWHPPGDDGMYFAITRP
jgi:hypothetical protein